METWVSRLRQDGPDDAVGTCNMTKGVEMKKLTLLSMLLGLSVFVVGCGETKSPPLKSAPPTNPPVQNTPPAEDTTSPAKEGDAMPEETKPDDAAPADDNKATDDAAPADDKASDEKPE